MSPTPGRSVFSKGGVEVRHDDKIIDEVVARGVDVHLEYLSYNMVWLKIGDVVITMSARARPFRVEATAEADTGGLSVFPPKKAKR